MLIVSKDVCYIEVKCLPGERFILKPFSTYNITAAKDLEKIYAKHMDNIYIIMELQLLNIVENIVANSPISNIFFGHNVFIRCLLQMLKMPLCR